MGAKPECQAARQVWKARMECLSKKKFKVGDGERKNMRKGLKGLASDNPGVGRLEKRIEDCTRMSG